MKWFRMTPVALVCAALIALALVPRLASHAQVPGQNLLSNSNFEAANWRAQDGIGELVVAPGWRAWYVDVGQVRSYVKPPSNCNASDPACYWMRPEFNAADAADFPNRVHSGLRAQKYFSYGRMHEAGLYQRVIGVQSGVTLRFSIFMQAWQCSKPENCGEKGSRSDAPAEMHLRVGIDPYGGSDPFSANVIWSPEKPAFDQWVLFSVQAQAKGSAVTVFTHSRAEWDWPRTNNDVYLDDASLTIVDEGAAQPGATSATRQTGTPEPTFTPANTPTPRADGAIVHIVGPGDTLYGISLQYGVPYDDLLRLNNLSRTAILEIGQPIVVKAGTVTPSSTPMATLTLTPTNTQTPMPPTTAPTRTSTPLPPATQPVQPEPTRSSVTLPLPVLIAAAIVIVVVAVLIVIRRRR